MRQRQDRWTYHPVCENGEPIVIKRPCPGDFDKFDLFRHYRTLNAPLTAALLGTNVERERKRLKTLASEPNRYLDLYNLDTQKRWVQLNGYQWYSLGKNGAEKLAERGVRVQPTADGNPKELAHETGIQGTLASIDIGMRQTGGATMRYSTDILGHPNFPEKTRKSDSPFSIEVTIKKKFDTGWKEKEFHYRPDGFRWIKYDSDASLIVMHEYEHKNRAASTSFNSTSFLQKFLAVQSIVEGGLCEDRWGIPRESLITLVTTPSQAHIDTIIEEVVLPETKGKGCEYIAFNTYPSLAQTLSIVPKPELWTGPWQRVGYPDLFLNNPEAA